MGLLDKLKSKLTGPTISGPTNVAQKPPGQALLQQLVAATRGDPRLLGRRITEMHLVAHAPLWDAMNRDLGAETVTAVRFEMDVYEVELTVQRALVGAANDPAKVAHNLHAGGLGLTPAVRAVLARRGWQPPELEQVAQALAQAAAQAEQDAKFAEAWTAAGGTDTTNPPAHRLAAELQARALSGSATWNRVARRGQALLRDTLAHYQGQAEAPAPAPAPQEEAYQVTADPAPEQHAALPPPAYVSPRQLGAPAQQQPPPSQSYISMADVAPAPPAMYTSAQVQAPRPPPTIEHYSTDHVAPGNAQPPQAQAPAPAPLVQAYIGSDGHPVQSASPARAEGATYFDSQGGVLHGSAPAVAPAQYGNLFGVSDAQGGPGQGQAPAPRSALSPEVLAARRTGELDLLRTGTGVIRANARAHEGDGAYTKTDGRWTRTGEAVATPAPQVFGERRDEYQNEEIAATFDSRNAVGQSATLAHGGVDRTAYMSAEEREGYGAQVQGTGPDIILVGKDGKPLDTSAARTTLRTAEQGRFIFVLSTSGKLYLTDALGESAVRTQQDHDGGGADSIAVHHTSFLSGDDVLAAGDLKIVGGKLKALSNQSGHYRMGIESNRQALAMLSKLGVDVSSIPVETINPATRRPIVTPAHVIEESEANADLLFQRDAVHHELRNATASTRTGALLRAQHAPYSQDNVGRARTSHDQLAAAIAQAEEHHVERAALAEGRNALAAITDTLARSEGRDPENVAGDLISAALAADRATKRLRDTLEKQAQEAVHALGEAAVPAPVV